jgi:hypothetical protein
VIDGGRGFSPWCRARAWLGAALLVGLLVAAIPSAAAEARPLVTGITFVGDNDPLAYQRVRTTGAEMVRVLARWGEVAPRKEPAGWQPANPADPNYNWGKVDTEVIRAVEAGLTPVFTIHGAPQWAERCHPDQAGGMCDPDPAALSSFTTAAALRYSGEFAGLPRVRYWQGLNEPNLSLYFEPQFEHGKPASPAKYRQLINAFYFSIKSVQRSNLVLAAGLGPIEIPRFTIGPLRFTRELLCMRGRKKPRPRAGNCDGGVHFDIFDIHPYTTGGPNHRAHVNDISLRNLAELHALLQAAGRAGRIKGQSRHTPLWVTEFSWDSKPPDPGGVPMKTLSRWTAEALYRAWHAGVSRFFWLSLRDNPASAKLPFSQTIEAGLYFRGDSLAGDRPKPMMYAFRFPFVAFSKAKGFTYWGRTPSSKPGKVALQVLAHGKWRTTDVVHADKQGIFNGMVGGSYGRGRRGTVRARYRGEQTLPFSLKPVRDFHQPPFG